MKKVCAYCGLKGEIVCSDCYIDTGGSEFLCGRTACIDKHEAAKQCNQHQTQFTAKEPAQ